MRHVGIVLGVIAVVCAGRAVAQAPDVRQALVERGAPVELVEPVGRIVERVMAESLPAGPLADKALEGWAKHVRADLIVGALEQIWTRLREARAALVRAGFEHPQANLIAAAGEAVGRGFRGDDIGALARGAPNADQAAIGLQVAASLAAQGLERRAALTAVRRAYGQDGGQQLFELPSALADLRGQGVAMADVAERIMRGGGLAMPRGPGRPGSVPPGPGGKRGTRSGHQQ